MLCQVVIEKTHSISKYFEHKFKRFKYRCNQVGVFCVLYFFFYPIFHSDHIIIRKVADKISLILEKLNGMLINQIKLKILIANSDQGNVNYFNAFQISIM